MSFSADVFLLAAALPPLVAAACRFGVDNLVDFDPHLCQSSCIVKYQIQTCGIWMQVDTDTSLNPDASSNTDMQW
jgi:hypothetical protein